jgi:hypothetical protein
MRTYLHQAPSTAPSDLNSRPDQERKIAGNSVHSKQGPSAACRKQVCSVVSHKLKTCGNRYLAVLNEYITIYRIGEGRLKSS